jgi:hypothetical protein
MYLFFRFFYFFVGLEFLYLCLIFFFEIYRFVGMGWYKNCLEDDKFRSRILNELIIEDLD